MTILDRVRAADNNDNGSKVEKQSKETKPEKKVVDSSDSQMLTQVESQFKNIMDEFRATTGFSVETGEQPYDTMIELLSSKEVNTSITILLSFIRFCINHNLKKDITIKIGYNKPSSMPMNFAVNEEMLEDIYPGDIVEIN